ncbi:hypothetical protein SDRG_17292 [Saprolegnia diclina VS20]|uniref:Uncharacterized protein n=1 Tax=Saprolegnia diclina (strain VS20) TaxID=1156394 RepID=T0QYI8_SAPDV|nr:hypothetical protein SDRG_17292 [Saprolegnia diclina VS20]EQC24818.1 hypothetical protein SDRG_17292 [Saprolegnia diclina VS20]|eukprot:XP_008621753.1 hypothetical protein SDRG_17292 [Saprolegnia diclina VS20]
MSCLNTKALTITLSAKASFLGASKLEKIRMAILLSNVPGANPLTTSPARLAGLAL